MSNNQSDNSKRSVWASFILSAGGIVTFLADVSGIAQLRSEPVHVILILLGLTAMCTGFYGWVSKDKNSSVWPSLLAIAFGLALLCGAGVVVTGSKVHQALDANRTTNGAGKDSLISRSELWLKVGTGIDLDKAKPKVVTAGDLSGGRDVILDAQYGISVVLGRYYLLNGNSDPDSTDSICRNPDSGGAIMAMSDYVGAVVGSEYCFATSEGNPVWMLVAESTMFSFQTKDTGVRLMFRVWKR